MSTERRTVSGISRSCHWLKAASDLPLLRGRLESRGVKELKRIKQELRRRMHDDVDDTAKWLGLVLDGWLNYYAVPTSCRSLARFESRLQWIWLRSLRCRSQIRDEVYGPDSPHKGIADITIAKHRNGPIGAFRLGHSARFMRFDSCRPPE